MLTRILQPGMEANLEINYLALKTKGKTWKRETVDEKGADYEVLIIGMKT